MITNINEAHKAFYTQFITSGGFDNPVLSVPGIATPIPVRFYKKSAEDRSEEDPETYPVVSIQAFQPKLWPEMYNAYDPDRVTDTDYSAFTTKVARQPVPIKFKYQVSFASKNFVQDSHYNTWFLTKFLGKNADAFIYNPVTVPLNDNLGSEDIIGDYVGYSFEELEIIRESDGVFETAHIFTVGPVWIALEDMESADIPETVNITLKQLK